MDNSSVEKKIATIAERKGKTPEQVCAEIEDAIDVLMVSDDPEINLLRDVMIPHKGRITIDEYLQLEAIMNQK